MNLTARYVTFNAIAFCLEIADFSFTAFVAEYPAVKVIRTATEYFTYSAQEKVTSVHYSESFFEEYNLVALKVKTTNASVSYAVSGVYSLDNGQYSIWLTDKGSGAGATVMGVQNIFIGIPKAEHITENNLEVIFYDFWWM